MNCEEKLEILKRCDIASLDHMIHIDNLKTILEYGLYPHNNPYKKVDISNIEVNNRRSMEEPIYNEPIHEYVPFYFNPRNAMLYRNQKKFKDKIIILGFSNRIVCHKKVIFTNANASANKTLFKSEIEELLDKEFIDFSKVFSYSWSTHEGERDDVLKQIMMAEVLVKDYVDSSYIEIIYCQNNKIKEFIDKKFNLYLKKKNIEVVVEPKIFF
jgi:hypothetical protein